MPVTPPFELLDLQHQEVATFLIRSYEEGLTTIRPQGQPGVLEKQVNDMRVHVDPVDKPVGPPYYDVTSGTLQLQLKTWITQLGLPLYVKITKVGVPPKARFMVEASRERPAPAPGPTSSP